MMWMGGVGGEAAMQLTATATSIAIFDSDLKHRQMRTIRIYPAWSPAIGAA